MKCLVTVCRKGHGDSEYYKVNKSHLCHAVAKREKILECIKGSVSREMHKVTWMLYLASVRPQVKHSI